MALFILSFRQWGVAGEEPLSRGWMGGPGYFLLLESLLSPLGMCTQLWKDGSPAEG